MNKTNAGGELDLAVMLASLKPILDPQRYVFCTTTAFAPNSTSSSTTATKSMGADKEKEAELASIALATFREDEGLTLVLNETQARANGFVVETVFRRISLSVHSSLNAVGLTAAVSHALTQKNISANVIAAFYHDHVFVPEADVQDALQALNELGT